MATPREAVKCFRVLLILEDDSIDVIFVYLAGRHLSANQIELSKPISQSNRFFSKMCLPAK